MDLKDLIITLISSGGTFVATRIYKRREERNDLETKLLQRIEELSDKYLELNRNYTLLREKFEALEFENMRLRREMSYLNKKTN